MQKRWTVFAADFEELLKHTKIKDVPFRDSSGEMVMLPGDPPSPLIGILIEGSDELLRQFEEKWKLKVYSLEAIKILYGTSPYYSVPTLS